MPQPRYPVILEQGKDGYIVATVPALKGVISQGKTEAEALENINEAIELMIESLIAHTDPVPQCPNDPSPDELLK